MSSHENATPVKLIHNAAGHLNGPARTIGAGVIGYLGKHVCETTHNTSNPPVLNNIADIAHGLMGLVLYGILLLVRTGFLTRKISYLVMSIKLLCLEKYQN